MPASAQGLLEFVHASPSPQHCAAEAARRLQAAGFVAMDESQPFETLEVGHKGLVVRGGALIAWILGDDAPERAGFNLVGAHTDSPNLRLKPNPELHREGWRQWGVEVYGGALLHTWFDRDLGLAGQVAHRAEGGGVTTSLFRVDRPIARIPNLAIHLNRGVNDEGFKVNAQQHLPPVLGLTHEAQHDGPGALQRLVADTLHIAPDALLGWDLGLYEVTPPTLGGLFEELVFAPRLDNQASSYMAMEALLDLAQDKAGPGRRTAVIVLYDHEECGSLTTSGADSALLEGLLERLALAHPQASAAPGPLSRAASQSLLVSADMAHGVHPNYADRHEPQHKPTVNGGPVIKINSNNRYATTGHTAALFAAACAEEAVPVQRFVTRSDLPCGTTIGPIASSRLAIPTVDVGNPMLSMHSARELCGARDVDPMSRVMARLLRR